MLPDKEGFLYPEADKGKCIDVDYVWMYALIIKKNSGRG